MDIEAPQDLKMDAGTELSSQRTALSLERTGMSAERTQMSVLRTSLSLIGFGFTIYKFFQELGKEVGMAQSFGPPARNLGLTLVVLGVALLVAGLVNHYFQMRQLRRRRQTLYDARLLRTPPAFRTSANVVVTALLLAAGLLVVLGIATRIGPFA